MSLSGFEYLQHPYLNFFSLGALIPAVFVGLLSLFLFTIHKKSSATFWLALSFLWMFIFYFPYFPAATFFDPFMAYHRWFTVPFVLMAGLSFSQFFLHFPERSHPRFATTLLIVELIISVIITAFFYMKTLTVDRIFKFDGHYWDFAADDISRTTGIVILLLVVLTIGLGVWRGITRKDVRWSALGMALAFTVTTIVPTFTNILSRDGAVARGTHQAVINYCVILGFFALAIIYINSTRDRTTFMAKIVGISLAVFLLVLQSVGYLVLNDRDYAYDEVQHREAELVVTKPNYHPEHLRYVVAYDSESAVEARKLDAVGKQSEQVGAGTGFRMVYAREGETFSNKDFEHLRTEFRNAAMRGRIANIQATDLNEFRGKLETVLATAHPQFAGYAALLRSLAEVEATEDTGLSPARDVLARADALHRRVLWTSNKIRGIDAGPEFADAARERLAGLSGEMQPFAAALDAALTNLVARGADDASIKANLLEYLRPFKPLGSRHFRGMGAERVAVGAADASGERDFFVGFQIVRAGTVYEIGFSYLDYRTFAHEASVRIFWLLLGVIVIVLIGFRIFFHGALLSPLDNLLKGVRRVNSGDLDVELPIKVEDEIGFISHSFNSMVSSIRAAKARLQDYADHLEEKVKERTAELKNTLEEVQLLKKQQDGDYFLTSLLIKPLNANRSVSRAVATDFLVEQKKKFEFRERKSEIGGDICMVDQISLKDKEFTVFMNADAMGKSMQGAGGALVLGSVFESIVTRTQLSPDARSIYPERWLKNAFVELHKIFESFDGSMLISLVMGLVDEHTGFLYYINAEHPFTVVYRDGQAEFIERELLFRKLGTCGMEGMVHIPTFRLNPGDLLIAGSDGRDDIVLGVDEVSGERIINEDEEKFLTIVQEANGGLERMRELLLSEGQLSDDLSLLSVRFLGSRDPVPEDDEDTLRLVETAREASQIPAWKDAVMYLRQARLRNPRSPLVLRELVQASYHLHDFKSAGDLGREYLELAPWDVEALFLASLAYKQNRDFINSADLSERLRLREPWNVKNLLHLAEVYMHAGNLDRAGYILGQALEREPSNETAAKLRERLEARGKKLAEVG